VVYEVSVGGCSRSWWVGVKLVGKGRSWWGNSLECFRTTVIAQGLHGVEGSAKS